MEQENVLTKKFFIKDVFAAFWEKHSLFFSSIYTFAFYISAFLAFIQWLRLIFDSIRTGNFFAFVLAVLLQSFLMMINATLGAIIYGTIAVVILIIPYLVIRGFVRK